MRAAIASLLVSLSLISSGCTEALTYATNRARKGSGFTTALLCRCGRRIRNSDPPGSARFFARSYYLGLCYDELKQHHQAFAQYRASLM